MVYLARPASAQTTPPLDLTTLTIEDLMTIRITTASRAPEGLAAAPARVQVVTAARIERRGYRSVLDVLKDLADFKVDLAGDPDFPAQLGVQGMLGAGRVVLLLDGIRVSPPTSKPLPLMANYPVPQRAAGRDCLRPGVGAVWGGRVLGAVINIITRT
jgi:outer membrane cobalamin receptor